jgi:acyl carrier protein
MSRAASNAAPAAPAIEQELAALVVEVLNLDTPPGELDPLTPLYGDQGLGLDSIDILEMAVAISKRYGFQIRSDDPDNERIFGSLRALASHVAAKRTK